MQLQFNEIFTQFSLGNAAILNNVCLLPLYPGLIAFLAGNTQNERSQKATRWLGLLVLAGVLTMMMLVGMFLYLLRTAFPEILPIVLPLVYGIIILLGLLMLSGRNPFAKLATVQAPVLSNPYATAYVYGLLLGPMTLTCTGPIITTAFIVGAGDAGSLSIQLLYFIAFGIGFGWPLVILPFFAMPLQRKFTSFLTQNHLLLTRISGVMLIAIGVYSAYKELLPQWNLV